MRTPSRAWGLWDAGELLSLHLTQAEARDARAKHLDHYRHFCRDDRDLAESAIEIRPLILDAAPALCSATRLSEVPVMC